MTVVTEESDVDDDLLAEVKKEAYVNQLLVDHSYDVNQLPANPVPDPNSAHFKYNRAPARNS